MYYFGFYFSWKRFKRPTIGSSLLLTKQIRGFSKKLKISKKDYIKIGLWFILRYIKPNKHIIFSSKVSNRNREKSWSGLNYKKMV